ncbi:MAG: S41 family peptidase [Bacteroidota bacterium]
MKKLLFAFLLLSGTLSGQTKNFLFTLKYQDFGRIDFYMTFVINTKDSSFVAYSNPESIYNLIPFQKQILLKLMGKGEKRGAVIHIINGKISRDHFEGKAVSSIGNFDFSAENLHSDNLIGTFKNNQVQLNFTASPVKTMAKVSDYEELFQILHQEVTDKIYDPSILKRKDWRKFLKNMHSTLDKSIDDLDVLVAYFYNVPVLKTSHVYLSKADPMKDISNPENPNFEFKRINETASIITFHGFSLGDVKSVDSCLAAIKTPNLIVDLRDCPGGDFASLLFASHFIKKETYVGYFLGNKFYKQARALPAKDELTKLTPFVKGTLDDFFEIIDRDGILVGKVVPSSLQPDCKMYMLVNKNTASAAEPLAYFVKSNGIGTLIGETTSGKMLSAKSFNIYKDWYFTLPLANYYTIDNKELEQTGVAPDIETKSEDAMKKVMEIIQNSR